MPGFFPDVNDHAEPLIPSSPTSNYPTTGIGVAGSMFSKLKEAVVASQGGDQQLVLVSVEFGDATSNLFVIFDERGQIINVDISRDFV